MSHRNHASSAISSAASFRFKPTAALALAVLPPILSDALAQVPDAGATTLDTVVVTANKRTENVQEVPKAVLVVAPDSLSKAGVSTIRELGNVVPSIAGTTLERTSAPPIRGISSFSISIGVQSQTGVVIDDVPQAAFSSLFKELADIERVEVLPGPQSTLSGRNASGGLVNIITREPSAHFSADIAMEHTSDRQQRLSAFMTGPISETLAFSVSAFSNEWEGHLRSLTETSGNRPLHLNGWDTQGARGKLRWQTNDRLSGTLTLYSMQSTMLPSSRVPGGPYLHVDPDATWRLDPIRRRNVQDIFPGLVAEPWNRRVGSPRHAVYETRDHGGSLKLEYELSDGGALTSITSIARARLPRRENLLGVPFLPGMLLPASADPYSYSDHDTTSKIQEFRLTSPDGRAFDYLLGLIYSDSDTWHPFERLDVAPLNARRAFALQSGALFARGTWHLGARDALTVGLRYQHDDMSYRYGILPNVAGADVFTAYAEDDNRYRFFSGELSWRHALGEHVNTYLTLSSTESGEVYDLENQDAVENEGGLQPMPSQKSRNLEWGLKGQWWERRLTLNINAFLARYDHYHIQFGRDRGNDAPPVILLDAVGKVETRGVEFETRLRTRNRWSIGLNGAWMDTTIRDYPNPPCYSSRQTPAEGCINNTQAGRNLAGNRMPNVPRLRMSGMANYFIPLHALPFDLELGAAYRWQSRVKFDYRNNPSTRLEQDRYGILNLSAALLERNGRYSLSVFVNNALNKHFYSNISDDTFWSTPAYWGTFARDSFRYSGVSVRMYF